MPRIQLRQTLLSVLACICVTAHADLVYLTNGGVLEGNAHREGAKVVIVTPTGTITLPSSKVEMIVEKPTELDAFNKRFDAIDPKGPKAARAYADLGTWCSENGLKNQAETCFLRTLDIEPENAVARNALGYEKYQGRWMTPDEVRKARGLVKHADAWVTAEAKADLLKMEAEAELERARAEKERLRLARAEAELQEARRKADAALAEAEALREAYYRPRYAEPVVIWRGHRPCQPRYLPPVVPGPGRTVKYGVVSPLGVPTTRADGSTAVYQIITPKTGLRVPTVRVLPPATQGDRLRQHLDGRRGHTCGGGVDPETTRK